MAPGTFLVFFLFAHLDCNDAENVALRKQGTYCNIKNLSESSLAFDGERKFEKFVSLTEICATTAYVEVNLGENYAIQYIAVFQGRGENTGQLDYFKVYNTNDRTTEKCSEFPGRITGAISDRALRVNCRPSSSLYSYVKIESRKNVGLRITEMEVHSIGKPNERVFVYFGCFRLFEGERVIGDIDMCRKSCHYEGFPMLAIKNKHVCYCGHALESTSEQPIGRCDIKCDDGQTHCGGVGLYSVYILMIVLPFYHGCIETEETVNPSTRAEESLTISKCLQRCEGDVYATLQGGRYCKCRNNLPEHIEDSSFSSCTETCSGDGRHICGGERHISVYRTCSSVRGTLKCSTLLKCSWDMYGRCRDGCAEGFIGDFCMEKSHSSATNDAQSVPSLHFTRQRRRKVSRTQISVRTTGEISIKLDETTATSTASTRTTSTTRATTTIATVTSITQATSTTRATTTTVMKRTISTQSLIAMTTGDIFVQISGIPTFLSLHTTTMNKGNTSAVSMVLKTTGEVSKTSEDTISKQLVYSTITMERKITSETKSDACETSNPCTNRSNSMCYAHHGKAKCDCITGYSLHRSGQICKDINECDYEPCDAVTSKCLNLDGSFTCECNFGFVNVADDLCTENLSWVTEEKYWSKSKFVVTVFFVFPLASVIMYGVFTWKKEPPPTSEHDTASIDSAARLRGLSRAS